MPINLFVILNNFKIVCQCLALGLLLLFFIDTAICWLKFKTKTKKARLKLKKNYMKFETSNKFISKPDENTL